MKVDYKALKDKWIAEGEIPDWYSTNSLQFFMNKYSNNGESVRSRDSAVAKYLAENCVKEYPEWWESDPYTKGKTKEQVYFNAIWDGFVVPSTPLKANGGVKDGGCTVSCSISKIDDRIASAYGFCGELAVLTKLAHGTSVDMSSWPCRGTDLGDGNRSEGTLPILKNYRNVIDQIKQGKRRGSVAFYFDAEHGDFDAVAELLLDDQDNLNIGWLFTDAFKAKLEAKDQEAIRRWNRVMFIRRSFGRGYIAKPDTMNRNKAHIFKALGLWVYCPNLCTETNIPANDEYTATCVILNLNLTLWDTFPKHLMWIAHMMQDANITGYLKSIEVMKPESRAYMQKAYNFTKDFRAVGTGVCGFHSLLMMKKMVYGSMESFQLNHKIFSWMQKQAKEASRWLYSVGQMGLKMKGTGECNATTMFAPPTKSSTELARNAPSEGLTCESALIKVKESAGGEIFRINTVLLAMLKEKGIFTPEVVKEIGLAKGSIQRLPYFTDEEKAVMRIAFEIDQHIVVKMASARQQFFDQQQSINLHFHDGDSEEYFAEVHKAAILDEGINSLYYAYSSRSEGMYDRVMGCEVCQ